MTPSPLRWSLPWLLAALSLACGGGGDDGAGQSQAFAQGGFAGTGSAGFPGQPVAPGQGGQAGQYPVDPGSCYGDPPRATWAGCASDLTARSFAHGVCSCQGLSAPNTLTAHPGSPVGVNGSLTTSSPLRVSDRLVVAGPYQASNTFDVGELWVGGALSLSSPGRVAGDAHVGGPLTASNSLTVGGDLHLGAGLTGDHVAAAAVIDEAVTVAPPCDCGAPLDIGAIVADASPPGTRPAAGFDLGDPSQPIDVTLPCGRVYLPEIRTSNVTTLRVVGRTVVFVGGDVRTSSPLRLELAPGASVDLLVAGAFEPTNTVTLGSPGRALDLRLYVAGPVTLASPLVMSGYLYAPTSPFTPNNTVDLEGGALVGGLTVSSPFTVRPGGDIAGRDVCQGP